MLDYEAHPPGKATPAVLSPAVRLRRRFMYGSIAVFIISLTQHGFTTDFKASDDGGYGLGLLLVGCLGGCAGVFAWYANPLLFASWYLMSRPFTTRSRWVAALCTIASLSLCLSFLLHHQIMVTEAGHIGRILTRGLSYWSWLLSILIALAGCIAGWEIDEPAR